MKRKDLRARLAPLRSSSKPFVVDACGIKLEMRVLSNEDAQAIQQMVIDYGKLAVDDTDDANEEAADKTYRRFSAELQYHMKVETIARAVVSIDGMRDLVVTADDDSGKVELRDFLREEIADWDRPVTEEIYTAYGLKALREEIVGTLQVRYEPVDMSLEISRLEKLLERAKRGQAEQQHLLQERATEAQELSDIEKAGPPAARAPEAPEPPEQATADPAVFGGPPERVSAPPVEFRERVPRESLTVPPPGQGSGSHLDVSPMPLAGGSFLGDDTTAAIEEAERQQVAMRMRRGPRTPVERGSGSIEGEDGLTAMRGVAIPGPTIVPPRSRPEVPRGGVAPSTPGEFRLPPNLPVNQRPGDGAINPRFRGR